VNAERADKGLPALNHVSELDQSSRGMCERMVSEHFFSHETPDGKTVVDRVEPTGYIPKSGDWVVGENLAWGSGALSTPQSIVNGWMNSPGHRANILAPDYKDIGLAACMGSPTTTNSGGTVYVNNFGAKSGADLNATLPGHEDTGSGDSGDSGNGDATTATVAGTSATAKAAAKKRAACARKAKKKAKSAKARKAALKRCKKR
jgi:Cysteine-rich secretory protein family